MNENFVGNVILSVVELLGACYTWMNKNVMDRPFVVVLYIIERRWFCRGVRDQSFRTTHDDVDRSLLLHPSVVIKLQSIYSLILFDMGTPGVVNSNCPQTFGEKKERMGENRKLLLPFKFFFPPVTKKGS